MSLGLENPTPPLEPGRPRHGGQVPRFAGLFTFFVGLVCAVIAAGCAVEGRPFERATSSPDKSIIYVYRPYHYEGSLLRPPVTCGDDTARIGPGGYHEFVVPAGQQTECTVQWTETSDQVEIDGDKHLYYVREEFGWGVMTGHPHLNPVDTDQANSEIKQCCVEESPPAS
jgi:hypothetical protein